VIEWRLGDSPYHSTANDLFALLIKVKMKCTGKLRYSDVDSNKPRFCWNTSLKLPREGEQLSEETCGDAHLGRRD